MDYDCCQPSAFLVHIIFPHPIAKSAMTYSASPSAISFTDNQATNIMHDNLRPYRRPQSDEQGLLVGAYSLCVKVLLEFYRQICGTNIAMAT